MKTRVVKVGKYLIGGDNPIRVQSMTNTDTENVKSTIEQIRKLLSVGCEIIRISVPTQRSAENIKIFKREFPDIPLVADIHFDHKLALRSMENGIDKLRINPGNIKDPKHIKKIVEMAKDKSIPIRIGINGGSLPEDILKKYNDKLTPEGMFEAANREIEYFEDADYFNIIVSLKASDVITTVKANEMFRETYDYPLHIGITEAGGLYGGTIASSVGLGILLYEGIGETIRVSLSTDPLEEVRAAFTILKNLELREYGVTIHSCPTCSRTEINIIELSKYFEEKFAKEKQKITISIMGCVVNGPGEALNSDFGIVGTKKDMIIYKKGNIIKKIPKDTKKEKVFEIIKKLVKGEK